MITKLWLDDVRPPWKYGAMGWQWAKTYEEAVTILKTGKIEFASLDHDLAWEHYPGSGVDPKDCQEKTGYHVLQYIKDNNLWPKDGISVHSMNPVGRQRMEQVVYQHYGRNFPAPKMNV